MKPVLLLVMAALVGCAESVAVKEPWELRATTSPRILELDAKVKAAKDKAEMRLNKTDEWPPKLYMAGTYQYDGHWFIAYNGKALVHHPDCPCHKNKPEQP